MRDKSTIFDTDFDPRDRVLVYEDGEEVAHEKVGDLTREQRRRYGRYDWYLLAEEEDATALFVG